MGVDYNDENRPAILIFRLYTFSLKPDTLYGLVKQCSSEVGGMYARSDLEFLLTEI
jgi:hypothetical protein